MGLNRVVDAHPPPTRGPGGVGRTPNPEAAAHAERWGSYNDAPPNFQPCDPNEFYHWYSCYGFYAPREFRQFVIPDTLSPEVQRHLTGGRMESVELYYGAGDTGYGVVHRHEYDPASPVGYRYTVATFKFYLCDHDVVHVRTVANCLNEYRCQRCGWTYQVDSSD